MMYCLCGFAPTSIDSLNLVTDMTVVVFLSELCRGTVGRAANLRPDLVFLLGRPSMGQITNLNVKPAKLLIDFQILNVHITLQLRLPKLSFQTPETRNLTHLTLPSGRWFRVSVSDLRVLFAET